jgi:hypothetical protein
MEVEIMWSMVWNNSGLGLLGFKMLASRTTKHTSSVMKVKARKKLR